jgi:hypothetical protein
LLNTSNGDLNGTEFSSAPKQGSNPQSEDSHPSRDSLCANAKCRKGPDGTRGVVKSRRASYCCAYCRVAVCRRNRQQPKPFEKPQRKRRSDAKYASHAERQRAYERSRSWARSFRRTHFFKRDWDSLKARPETDLSSETG